MNIKMKNLIKYSTTVVALAGVFTYGQVKADGEEYILARDVKVYNDSASALKKQDSVDTYAKGKYHIYRKHNSMINISTMEGEPGAWIDPADNLVIYETPIYTANKDTEIFDSNKLNGSKKIGSLKKDQQVEAIIVGDYIRFEEDGKKVYAKSSDFKKEEDQEDLYFSEDTKVVLKDLNEDLIFSKGDKVVGKKINGEFRFSYNGVLLYTGYEALTKEKPEITDEDKLLENDILTVAEENKNENTNSDESFNDNSNEESNDFLAEDQKLKSEKELHDIEISQEETSVEEKAQEKPRETSGNLGQKIADYAVQFVGYNYILNEDSPETGFDCSGLTSYTYSKVTGKYIGRNVTAQLNAGYEVSKDDLRAGDLLYFGQPGDFYHVGIYIGNGQYVHAATEERGVVIDSVSGYFFQNQMNMARRIVD